MTLENIVEKIEEDARKEASIIITEAQNEARSISKKAAEKDRLEQEQHLRSIKQKTITQSQSIIAKARIKANEINLIARRDLIDQSFNQALTNLNGLSKDDYKQTLISILAANASGNEEVALSEDTDGPEIIKLANKALTDKSKKANLALSDKKINEKGFLLIDQKSTRNFTFESLVKYHKDLIETEVLKVLSEEKSER